VSKEMAEQTEPTVLGTPETVREWTRFRRVFLSRGVVVFGLVIVVVAIFVAIFAPLLAPYNPYTPNLHQVLQQPSKAHWLGTDALGRDTLSRVIFGTRTSLFIGMVVVSIAAIVGITLGTVAGYFGGWYRVVIMRFIDAMMAFPMILLALVIAALLGGGTKNVIIALSVGLLPAYARLMCGQVLAVKGSDYVVAAHSLGAGNLRIVLRHVLPNCFSALIVMVTMMLGSTILAEAGLSFLGVGIVPPTAAWGSMVNDGREYLLTLPILSFAPGLALMITIFALNMVGDGLRDALDPRLRGVI
jgi:peptide/nickel transport system permease protein